MTPMLQGFQPFNTLPETVLAELNTKLQVRDYPKDTYIFTQGQASLDYLFLIKAGMVQIIVQGGKGNAAVVGVRHPGQFFGETVLLSGKRYPAHAKAMKDLSCYLLHREVFEQLLQSHHEFASFFSRILTDRLRDLYEETILEQPAEVFGFSSEPFKKRVADLMSSPVVTCSPDMPVNEVARIFSQQKISSVVVTGPKGKLLGLVSERDLISKVMAVDSNPAVVRALDIMDRNPVTLPSDALFYKALLTMLQQQGKYILITAQGRPVGIITIGDLIKARAGTSLIMVKNIDSAENINELKEVVQDANQVVANFLREKAPANEICEVFSELVDTITRRLLSLAEESIFNSEGPPADYCWLALGGSGRRELNWEQQNALVYADVPMGKEAHAREYFAALSQFVVNGLNQCGFRASSKNLTAETLSWPLKAWKQAVRSWVKNPEALCRQFFDFRPVFGLENLALELREFTNVTLRGTPPVIDFLFRDVSVYAAKLKDSATCASGPIDLAAACSQLTGCIRLAAMQEGIAETTTLGRLVKLVKIQILLPEDAEYFEAAFQSLMLFRIRENLKQLSMGIIPNDSIDPEKLSPRQRSVLRESFQALERLQNLIAVRLKAAD